MEVKLFKLKAKTEVEQTQRALFFGARSKVWKWDRFIRPGDVEAISKKAFLDRNNFRPEKGEKKYELPRSNLDRREVSI